MYYCEGQGQEWEIPQNSLDFSDFCEIFEELNDAISLCIVGTVR